MGRRKILMSNAALYEIFIIGEQLRVQMTSAGQVKDRRHHLRKYRKCIIGREAVDWLVKNYHVQSRDDALKGMQILLNNGLIHHVVDDHDFKDQHLFYRFTYDDNTFKMNKDLASFYRGIDIYRILKTSTSEVMRNFYHKGILYKEAFYGSDAVDQVAASESYPDRDLIIKDFRDLLEKDIIKHVTDDYHFSYDRLIYEFNLDFQKPCLLHDVIDTAVKLPDSGQSSESKSFSLGSDVQASSIKSGRGSSKSSSSATDTFRLISKVQQSHAKKSLSKSPYNDSMDSGVATGNTSTAESSPPGSIAEGDDTLSVTSMEPRSVLIRPVTLDELEDPEAPIVKRFIQIERDEIGFGFVLRGESPSYVQAVDPLGPAAKAGMKVRQFISHINGHEVIRMGHKEVSQLTAQFEILNILVLMHRSSGRLS